MCMLKRNIQYLCVCVNQGKIQYIFCVFVCVCLSKCMDAFMACLCVFVIMYVYVKITYYCL